MCYVFRDIMLNPKLFQQLLKDFMVYSSKRHQIIKDSSDALRLSKQAIFTLHRDEIEPAEKLISEIESILKNIKINFEKDPSLRYEGSFRAALEEYAEAKFFYNVLVGKKIDFLAEEEINYEGYLAGICDLTGELVRKAVNQATKGKFNDVKKYRDVTEEIIGELIKFNMNNGHLRSKYDDAKRNLRRLEEILYDVKIKR